MQVRSTNVWQYLEGRDGDREMQRKKGGTHARPLCTDELHCIEAPERLQGRSLISHTPLESHHPAPTRLALVSATP